MNGIEIGIIVAPLLQGKSEAQHISQQLSFIYWLQNKVTINDKGLLILNHRYLKPLVVCVIISHNGMIWIDDSDLIIIYALYFRLI